MIRVVVFPERPQALLVVTGEGYDGMIALPALRAPFVLEETAAAPEGVARVSIDRPRRLGEAVAQAGAAMRAESLVARQAALVDEQARALAMRAERREESLRRQEAAAALARSSNDPLERKRGALLGERIDLERAILDLKASMHGMDAAGRAALETNVAALRLRDEKALEAIAKLRKEQKARNVEASARGRRDFFDRFLIAARARLDPETYEALIAAALPDDEEATAS